MKIGYACIPVGIDKKTTHSFMLKNFNEERFLECTNLNLENLLHILNYNIKNNIFMFRISSDIIPFGSHEINNINWTKIFENKLSHIGNFINKNNLRVSMHPGQYTVLNSTSPDIVSRSIKDIEYHTAFLDSLHLSYSNKIVVHIGGVYNDRSSAIERFKLTFQKLSSSAKKRLVVENDERCFNIEEVLSICHDLNIPAVFDNLHHKYNPPDSLNSYTKENLKYILRKVNSTWKSEDGNMKLHYSDEDETKKACAHSKFVITENFLNYYDIVKDFNVDIMLEVKNKDISAIKCINCTNKIKKSTIFDEWAKYKYLVMEKNYSYYKQCSKIVNSDNKTIIDFYKFIDFALLHPFSNENYNNTLLHVWGYFKDKASDKEKLQFKNLLENNLTEKAKAFLLKLSKKYEVKYLLNSYYFINS